MIKLWKDTTKRCTKIIGSIEWGIHEDDWSTWHWMQPFKWCILISIISKGIHRIVWREGRKIISSEGLVSLHHRSLIDLFLSFSSFISSFEKWMWDLDLGCWILDFLYWTNDDSCSYVVFFFSLLCLASSFDQLDFFVTLKLELQPSADDLRISEL